MIHPRRGPLLGGRPRKSAPWLARADLRGLSAVVRGGSVATWQLDHSESAANALMAMSGGMEHSAPVIGSPALSDDEYYGCAVVFSMPSGTMGSWSVKASVQRPGAAAVEATFSNLTVADTGRAKSFTFTDPTTSATTKYLVSLNLKAAPKVGLNPVVVTFHRMQDMMTFVPVDDATIALDPQMPSMGHGSPGSVNPTLTAPGRFEGQLSFSMAGDWQTTISLSKSTGESLGSVTIATTF